MEEKCMLNQNNYDTPSPIPKSIYLFSDALNTFNWQFMIPKNPTNNNKQWITVRIDLRPTTHLAGTGITGLLLQIFQTTYHIRYINETHTHI